MKDDKITTAEMPVQNGGCKECGVSITKGLRCDNCRREAIETQIARIDDVHAKPAALTETEAK